MAVTVRSMNEITDFHPNIKIFDESDVNPEAKIVVYRVKQNTKDDSKIFPATEEGYKRARHFVGEEQGKGRSWIISFYKKGYDRIEN